MTARLYAPPQNSACCHAHKKQGYGGEKRKAMCLHALQRACHRESHVLEKSRSVIGFLSCALLYFEPRIEHSGEFVTQPEEGFFLD